VGHSGLIREEPATRGLKPGEAVLPLTPVGAFSDLLTWRLLRLTAKPTAAGREHRGLAARGCWIRPDLISSWTRSACGLDDYVIKGMFSWSPPPLGPLAA
jgi:hypothetical protein